MQLSYNEDSRQMELIRMDNHDDELDKSNCQLEDVEEPLADVDPDIDITTVKVSDTQPKYAPVIPPIKGEYTLYCMVIRWLDNPGSSAQSATSACRKAAQTWSKLSNNLYNFTVVTKIVKVNLTHNAKNLKRAESIAKKSVNAKPFHIYAIFNNNVQSSSHGNGDTASLNDTLTRTVLHETGHCDPTNLGHSGAYKNGKLDPYGDGTSFMGKFASDKLTGAQLYLLGWLPQNKVALYNVGDAPTNFNIQNLYGADDINSFKVVLIPRENQRPIYLSMPQVNGKPRLCLHLSSGKGTQRITVFGNYATYDGLAFQKVSSSNGYVTVQINSM